MLSNTVQVVAGNGPRASDARADRGGADAVEGGDRPRSIRTTRIVVVGVPQLTAIMDPARAAGRCDRGWRDQVFRRFCQGHRGGGVPAPQGSATRRDG
ncbi:MAG: IMP dehydrogenase [Paracoccaceae bacterium]